MYFIGVDLHAHTFPGSEEVPVAWFSHRLEFLQGVALGIFVVSDKTPRNDFLRADAIHSIRSVMRGECKRLNTSGEAVTATRNGVLDSRLITADTCSGRLDFAGHVCTPWATSGYQFVQATYLANDLGTPIQSWSV